MCVGIGHCAEGTEWVRGEIKVIQAIMVPHTSNHNSTGYSMIDKHCLLE